MKALICTPCAEGKVHADYMLSMLSETMLNPDRLMNQRKYDIGLQIAKGASGLGKDRGTLASFALREKMDKLVFIDSDQQWTWRMLKSLLDSEKPIIGGIVALKKYPVSLNFTACPNDKHFFEGPGQLADLAGLEKMVDHHGTNELKVTAVGTGFLVIDVAVLKALSEICPTFKDTNALTGQETIGWDFFQTTVINGTWFGEDWGFCLKAAECGFETHINASVRPAHIGQHTYFVESKRV